VQLKRAPARFQKVLSKIEGDILEGVYREDDVLPSDTELSKQHGVSVATARRAYSELVHRGWVKRVRKRGTILCREALGTRLRRVGLIMVADVPAFQILRSGIESALAEYSTAIETRWNLDVPSVNEEAIRRSISEGAHGLIVTPPIQSSFETESCKSFFFRDRIIFGNGRGCIFQCIQKQMLVKDNAQNALWPDVLEFLLKKYQ
jgi:DNA-binding transcriptional MocR family regulator